MPGRILIAEDEPFIVESLMFLLGRQGYETAAVGDGLSVMKSIDEWQPHLLILDVMLPEMNGFDVLRHIRVQRSSTDLPVMVLTAKGQDADRLRMAELGANAFITKPFSNSDLLDQIAGMFAGVTADDVKFEDASSTSGRGRSV